jgi:hypothetical protein
MFRGMEEKPNKGDNFALPPAARAEDDSSATSVEK